MASPAFERSLETVSGIASQFKKNELHYLSSKFHEADARQLFIDKFWDALGWDIYHRKNPNPYEREVRIEKNVIVEGRGKRADYAFYTSPDFLQPRFLAEAKKPSRNLENSQDCFQAIRYGWNSNTPIAVLTDFEQFLILDSRHKPNIDTAVTSILEKYHYEEFADEESFRRIYHLFSRDSVLDESIDKYARSLDLSLGKRRSKAFSKPVNQPFDEHFLKELDTQRLSLARAFKSKNPTLDSDTLTEITQRTLDRLIFLRFLEDKLVEGEPIIENLGKKSKAPWRDFIAEMPRLNRVYNGILFKNHSLLDNSNFQPEEAAFVNIRNWLAYADSPYDFNIIPLHILGSIYERFLGKVIEETNDKNVTVVDKPTVRKAGGVYYTPEYIVRYIIENTVGKLIKGKTPEEISKMRFADISCGSGSFLLGIFDYLIAYHVKYYNVKTRRDKAIKQGICREAEDGTLQLSIHFKREILINNVFGVDLDAQAVEVAQLSLYLKLLEEETPSTKQYLKGYREQLLPSLDKNIVHGNSLIDRDVEENYLIDVKDLKKLNPMNFAQVFPEVFQKGGFDAVVGNPPYVVIGKDIFQESSINYFSKYDVAEYKVDLFHLFIQRGIDLLKDDGELGVIVPNTWLTLKFTEKLRRYILQNTSISEIIVFGHQVFKDATVHTALLFLRGAVDSAQTTAVKNISFAKDINTLKFAPLNLSKQSTWLQSEGAVFETRLQGKTEKLIKRLSKDFPRLDSVARASLGCQAYNSSKHTKEQIENRVFHSEIKLSDEYLPELAGKDVSRYFIKRSRGQWIKYGSWLHDYRTMDWLEGARILIREISGAQPYSIQASYVEETYCNYKTILNVSPSSATKFSMKYLVGILNSRLISFIYPYISNKIVAQTFPRLSVGDIKKLPIRDINFKKEPEKAKHEKIVQLVDKMIEAKRLYEESLTDSDKKYFERRCESLDGQIDEVVYDLYGISGDERELVEGEVV